ncbi:MAG: hypothetical protein PHI13_15125, partial [Methylococcales bacterium]|nr:hypothetical protein [Methylococcales bacterium]
TATEKGCPELASKSLLTPGFLGRTNLPWSRRLSARRCSNQARIRWGWNLFGSPRARMESLLARPNSM